MAFTSASIVVFVATSAVATSAASFFLVAFSFASPLVSFAAAFIASSDVSCLEAFVGAFILGSVGASTVAFVKAFDKAFV